MHQIIVKLLKIIYSIRISIYSEEVYVSKILKKKSGKNYAILDVGCGYGRFYKYAIANKFDYYGVDINENIVKWNSDDGRKVTHIDENKHKNKKYDIILMSHIIEHLEPKEVVGFIEEYAAILNYNGCFIFLTPLMHKGFYDDYDHVKPYNPAALRQLFCKKTKQIQTNGISGNYVEESFWIKKDPLWHSYSEKPWHHLISAPLDVLCGLTCGLIGKVTGYIIVFRKAD